MGNEITITLRANDQGSVEIQKFASKGKKAIVDWKSFLVYNKNV